MLLDIREVEERILRACKTLRALPDPDSRFQQFVSLWPDVRQAAEDAYGYNEVIRPKFRPTPSDVSEYLESLGWARGMDWREFRLIWWRSFDISFKHISIKIHKSDETARRWYKDCILKCWVNAKRTKGK